MNIIFDVSRYLLPLIVFSGCAAMSWQHQTKNQSEYLSDRFSCENHSAKLFPAVFVTEQTAPGYYRPVHRECKEHKGESSCIVYGGDYVQPQFSTVDKNIGNRLNNFDACMESQGWVYREVEKIK